MVLVLVTGVGVLDFVSSVVSVFESLLLLLEDEDEDEDEAGVVGVEVGGVVIGPVLEDVGGED